MDGHFGIMGIGNMDRINLIPLSEYLSQLEQRPSGEVITYGITYNGKESLNWHFKSSQDRDKIIQYFLERGITAIQPYGKTIWGTYPRTVNVDESITRGEWIWDDWK